MIKSVKSTISANRLAKEVRDIVDAWSGKQLSTDEAKMRINTIMEDRAMHLKIMRGETYTGTFENVMGKKRLKEFEELLDK